MLQCGKEKNMEMIEMFNECGVGGLKVLKPCGACFPLCKFVLVFFFLESWLEVHPRISPFCNCLRFCRAALQVGVSTRIGWYLALQFGLVSCWSSVSAFPLRSCSGINAGRFGIVIGVSLCMIYTMIRYVYMDMYF